MRVRIHFGYVDKSTVYALKLDSSIYMEICLPFIGRQMKHNGNFRPIRIGKWKLPYNNKVMEIFRTIKK